MEKPQEEFCPEYEVSKATLEQYQHKGQRLESRSKYYQQGDRKSVITTLLPMGWRLRA